MLQLIVVLFAVFALIVKLVDVPTVKRIRNARNTETAIALRKQLLRNRKIVFTVFVALIILASVYAWIVLENYDASWEILIAPILAIAILVYYLKTSGKYQEVQGNVSTQTASEFLAENERFALFLRGFESDVYDSEKAGKWDFSEDVLARVIRKGLGIPMCAVGMTKEADSPLGGQRVYVEDETWEKDVLELMQKAEIIIIRINDRKSCLWELIQAKAFIQKCVFVMDDLYKYHNARVALAPDMHLPDIPPADEANLSPEYDPRSFFCCHDMQMRDFRGEISDYCEMLGLDSEAVTTADIKDNKKDPFYRRPFFIALMIATVISLISTLL